MERLELCECCRMRRVANEPNIARNEALCEVCFKELFKNPQSEIVGYRKCE